jgi:hypothetical protein
MISLKICDLPERITPDIGIAMEGVGLGVDRHTLWDVMSSKLGTALRHHTRQTAGSSTVKPKRLFDDRVEQRKVDEIILGEAFVQSCGFSFEGYLQLRPLQHCPCEVGQSNTCRICAGDDHVHGLDSYIHIVNVAVAFFLTILNDLSEDVVLASTRPRCLHGFTGSLEDEVVGVEHFLHRVDGDESQETEERHLDHDACAHCELLEDADELIRLSDCQYC